MLKEAAEHSMAGFFTRIRLGRPRVTLKLAMSIDGRIALASGESKWITGEVARADVHRERARADMILVGRGTYETDRPQLDVRLPGLEHASPRQALLTTGGPVDGFDPPVQPAGDPHAQRRQRSAGRRAARRPPPPSSPPIWSTACSSIARRS